MWAGTNGDLEATGIGDWEQAKRDFAENRSKSWYGESYLPRTLSGC